MSFERLNLGPRAGRVAFAAWSLALLSLSGCSDPPTPFKRVSVQGTVMLDGHPISAGTIRFVPLDDAKGPKVSLPIAQGRYVADESTGPAMGRHRVEVEMDGDKPFAHDDEQTLVTLEKQRSRVTQRPKLPTIYQTNSPLSAVIQEAMPAPLDFNLSSQAR